MDVPRTVVRRTTSQKNKRPKMRPLFNFILEITSEKIILPETGAAGNMIKSLGKNFWLCRVCSKRLAQDEIIPHVSSSRHNMLLQKHKSLYTDNYKPPAIDPKPSTVDPKPSTGDPNPSTVDPKPSTVDPKPSTVDPKPSTVNPKCSTVDPKDRTTRLQRALDRAHMKPLIGIEYILEIVHHRYKPRYLCTLCDNSRCYGAVSHLQSYSHKMRYVKKHFETAVRLFNKPKVKKKVKEPILNKIAREIHKTYGRSKPTQISIRDYEAKKNEALQIPQNREHFCESYGRTFEDLVIEELAKKKPTRKGLSRMVDNEVSSTQAETSGTVIKKVKNKTRENDFGGPNNLDGIQKCMGKRISNNEPSPLQNLRICTPTHADKNEDDNANKMVVFIKLAKDIHDEMEKELLKYRENPDDHPQYNDEWKKFWKRRYMELQTEGKDISTYDLIPEWKEFWNERLLELHNEETKSKKIALGEMLRLVDERIPLPTFGVLNKDREVVLIDDDVNCENPPRKRTRSVSPLIEDFSPECRRRRVSPSYHGDSSRQRESPSHNKYSLGVEESSPQRTSPLYCTDSPSRYNNSPSRYNNSPSRHRDPPCRRRDSPSSRRDSPSHGRSGDSYNKQSNTVGYAEINIIGVLRLLTALEDRLGSLGPKVIEMLSNALAMENKRSKSSEDLLDNETNCILLETVGEKLKGQLQSGLLDKAEEKVFKTVLSDVESVINIAKQRNRRKRQESTENLMTEKDSSQPTMMTDNYENVASSEWSSPFVQGKRDDTFFQHKPASGRMNENDRYTPFSMFNTTSRIDEKEKKSFQSIEESVNKSFEDIMKSPSQKLKELQRMYEEEKRKIESLVGPLMNNPKKSGVTSLMVATNTDWNRNAKISNISGLPASSTATSKFSAGFPNVNNFSFDRQSGFSTPDGNKSLQKNTNQSLLISNVALLKGQPFSNETLLRASNIEQRGGHSTFRPERGGDFRQETTSGIADFRDGLSNRRVGHNREGSIDSNDQIIPPNFRGNSRSGCIDLRDDFQSISNFTKPQANHREELDIPWSIRLRKIFWPSGKRWRPSGAKRRHIAKLVKSGVPYQSALSKVLGGQASPAVPAKGGS